MGLYTTEGGAAGIRARRCDGEELAVDRVSKNRQGVAGLRGRVNQQSAMVLCALSQPRTSHVSQDDRSKRARRADLESTCGFTTLIGAPAAYALIWSKMSENCRSHSSRVT